MGGTAIAPEMVPFAPEEKLVGRLNSLRDGIFSGVSFSVAGDTT